MCEAPTVSKNTSSPSGARPRLADTNSACSLRAWAVGPIAVRSIDCLPATVGSFGNAGQRAIPALLQALVPPGFRSVSSQAFVRLWHRQQWCGAKFITDNPPPIPEWISGLRNSGSAEAGNCVCIRVNAGVRSVTSISHSGTEFGQTADPFKGSSQNGAKERTAAFASSPECVLFGSRHSCQSSVNSPDSAAALAPPFSLPLTQTPNTVAR